MTRVGAGRRVGETSGAPIGDSLVRKSVGGRCLAMWSGPRNLSTAMMRAWENRADTVVVDEPFYAHFLDATGLDHPMASEVIAAGDTDWRRVVAALVEPPASGFLYQKHITTHWLPHFGVGLARRARSRPS